MIILPRQARGQTLEKLKKSGAFSGFAWLSQLTNTPLAELSAKAAALPPATVRKTDFRSPFLHLKTHHFYQDGLRTNIGYQDRLGTNMGKALKKRLPLPSS
jgi:hypothetical protein